MATVTFKDATRIYPGNPEPSVDKLNLEIKDGELLVLVGPSGCGKSTSLRMLAGLEPVDEGQIFIGDRDVTDVAPKNRDIAMVFQNYALYPHMTVRQNMGFALQIAKMPKDEIEKRVKQAAEILDLSDLLDRKPRAMSGGQRQRVAMGRAIVRKPEVFLLDEPLSNLDAKLRVQTRTQIAKLQRDLGVTMVYVTHDQTEAMTMGDRICVLKDGMLMQLGTPRELYDRPQNVFVAGFIGSPAMNLLEVAVENGAMTLGGCPVGLPDAAVAQLKADNHDRIVFGVRPEDLDLVPDRAPGSFPLEVILVESLGADAFVYGEVKGSDGSTHQVTMRTEGRVPPARGDIVYLQSEPAHTHLFDAATSQRLQY
ncbi:MAG: ABC transporter ATP-binding protein [Candidatus Nanopelagicales bacterium]